MVKVCVKPRLRTSDTHHVYFRPISSETTVPIPFHPSRKAFGLGWQLAWVNEHRAFTYLPRTLKLGHQKSSWQSVQDKVRTCLHGR